MKHINFLISLFYNEEPIVIDYKPNRLISQYVNYESIKLFGIKTYKVSLTLKGKDYVKNILLMLGRKIRTNSGIAIEKREWKNVTNFNLKAQKIEDAFVSICKRGSIEFELCKDSFGRRKIVTYYMEKGINKISINVGWESNKRDPRILKDLGWSDDEILLWCHFFDVSRSEIREIECQQEFVIFD